MKPPENPFLEKAWQKLREELKQLKQQKHQRTMKTTNQPKSKAAQLAALCAVALWAVLSLLILSGEQSPSSTLTFGQFLLIKAASMASLLLCLYVGKRLNKAGYFPKTEEEAL